MPTESLITVETCAVRLLLTGRVQGLGVRPTVARIARRLNLAGSVSNTVNGLSVEIEGESEAVTRFLAEFDGVMPTGVIVVGRIVESVQPSYQRGFTIRELGETGAGAAALPVDLATCDDCLLETRDSSNRRHDYAFTSCTQCGPRYSIITTMPYDRPATSMHRFALCAECGAEYRSADNRRFHAQTNACPRCGPNVWLVDASGHQTGAGSAALDLAAAALCNGRILALKGLGGYQLLADATSSEAVQRLRIRKGRRKKPLAVMVRDLNAALRIADFDETAQSMLRDPAGPIVVVERRIDGQVTPDIAPELSTCGLMLPTTPLHARLLDRVDRPLVATSGNREGGALAYDEDCAQRELAGIADLWLHHNRSIVRPIDDSVVRVVNRASCVLRLARGMAPLPLSLGRDCIDVPIVALGGEQKSAFALANRFQAVLGPHIGDLGDVEVCQRWQEQLESFTSLYGVSLSSAVIVHDAHPDYFTTRWAQQHASHRQAVFHHHAHIAAVMLEHGLVDEVLGLAWDGAGYGADGAIWGGECLCATRNKFQRTAWLRPFPLPGGDRAVREPWRVAVAMVNDALGSVAASKLAWKGISPQQVDQIIKLLGRPRLMPQTSSMGRLFDAVAALALGVAGAEDDGRPAILLEQACDADCIGTYPLPWDRATGIADWRPLIAAVVKDVHCGATPGAVAMRFHRAIVAWAGELSEAYPDLPLVTSGGVFQNAVLGELLARRVGDRRNGWWFHRQIPSGDGGLAAGQLAVAAARIDARLQEK